ncbi:unnamed protein product [Rangifer tarandus platyrhynchus]|uniref:Uncharacterized protein n=2 Tax=Rangifer tarandus platyrhynchus TaxID=3082113 RepID=A0ACB0DZU4_RANTA|nr:unnamed protein product [Rangifer tarandus platyrhynchus]CAI9693748.1 unnamed protein product [Rangifer tarandus platyrhynchus]
MPAALPAASGAGAQGYTELNPCSAVYKLCGLEDKARQAGGRSHRWKWSECGGEKRQESWEHRTISQCQGAGLPETAGPGHVLEPSGSRWPRFSTSSYPHPLAFRCDPGLSPEASAGQRGVSVSDATQARKLRC